jgi:hypothetical protein
MRKIGLHGHTTLSTSFNPLESWGLCPIRGMLAEFAARKCTARTQLASNWGIHGAHGKKGGEMRRGRPIFHLVKKD